MKKNRRGSSLAAVLVTLLIGLGLFMLVKFFILDNDTTTVVSVDGDSPANKGGNTGKQQNENNQQAINTNLPKKKAQHSKNHKSISNDFAYDTQSVRDNMNNPEYNGKKIAFLTFDDGVNTIVTPKVLDALKEKGVYATFFIPGNTLLETGSDEVLKRMYDEGHAIATHSFNHDYDKLYPGRKADAKYIEVEYTDSVKQMKHVLGEDFDTPVWRYPGGHLSWDKESLEASDKALSDKGAIWIDWNSMTGDAQPKKAPEGDISRPTTEQEVIDNFEYSLRFTSNPDQAVILMHDARDKELTASALGGLIDHLKKEGYEFGILE